jgi:hypothetical protein
MVARVQTAFDLVGGRLADVLVTDEQHAENGNRCKVQVGDRINGSQQRSVDLVANAI